MSDQGHVPPEPNDTPDKSGRPLEPGELGGYERARRALEEARAAARAAGKSVGRGRASPVRRTHRGSGTRKRWSGAGPDGRDPQPFGRLVSSIAMERGWQEKIGEGTVFGLSLIHI